MTIFNEKVHIFSEGHKVYKIPPYYIGQIYGGDYAKFCGLLRIYELRTLSYENVGDLWT